MPVDIATLVLWQAVSRGRRLRSVALPVALKESSQLLFDPAAVENLLRNTVVIRSESELNYSYSGYFAFCFGNFPSRYCHSACENTMTRTDWLMKFRRYQNLETLEKVFEHLCYTGNPDEEFTMTQAYDHRKAEFAAGQLFDRVPKHVWQYVK